MLESSRKRRWFVSRRFNTLRCLSAGATSCAFVQTLVLFLFESIHQSLKWISSSDVTFNLKPLNLVSFQTEMISDNHDDWDPCRQSKSRQCRVSVGSASHTVDQHYSDIGSVYWIYREVIRYHNTILENGYDTLCSYVFACYPRTLTTAPTSWLGFLYYSKRYTKHNYPLTNDGKLSSDVEPMSAMLAHH